MSVYVHGVGAITSFGDWKNSADALWHGRSAIGPVTRFDASGFPCSVAAEIPLETEGDRRLELAYRAAEGAMRRVPAGELGVFVGAESGRATWGTLLEAVAAAGGGRTFDHEAFALAGPALSSRFDTATLSPDTVAVRLAQRYHATGPVRTVSLACSSSLAALVEAVRAIRCGACSTALVGGVGADVDPLMLAGFGLLGALSSRGAARPFDVRRDGFVVGEGAAFLVLSTAPSDLRVAGTGRSLDAGHLTQPDAEGRGARRAMLDALDGTPVDVVQAHGTSTPLNDAVEAAALLDLCPGARVSSVKGALGHWVAGAGALGVLCAIDTLRTGRLFPTAGLEQPAFPLDFIGPGQTLEAKRVLVNAFAFGGANSSAVLERV